MLAARSLEDLSRFRDSLIAGGYPTEPIPDRRLCGHFVFRIRDPDGHEGLSPPATPANFP
jgi:Glyoxalase/Bleomycin resistance protein/Dioxygenase superfamily